MSANSFLLVSPAPKSGEPATRATRAILFNSLLRQGTLEIFNGQPPRGKPQQSDL